MTKTGDESLSKRLCAQFNGTEYCPERAEGGKLCIFNDPRLGTREPQAPADINAQNAAFKNGSAVTGERLLIATFIGEDWVTEREGGILSVYLLGSEFAQVVHQTQDHVGALRQMNDRNRQITARAR